jgi:structural maintenance of chromosome 4
MSSDEDATSLLENLSKEVSKVEQVLQECRQRRLDIKKETRLLLKSIRSIEVSIPKLKLEVEGCDTTRQELTRLIPELQKQRFLTEEEVERRQLLEEKVRLCENDLQVCSSRADKLETEVTKLQNEIIDAGGPRLKKQKAIFGSILSRLKTAEKQLSTSKVEIISAERAEAKSSSTKKDIEEQLLDCETTLFEKEAAFKSLESGALEVMNAYENAKAVEAEKLAALDVLSSEVDDVKKLQTNIRYKEVELLGQLDAIEKQIFDCKTKFQYWWKEIENLQKCGDGLETLRESPETPDPMQIDQDACCECFVLSDGLFIFPHEKLEKYDPAVIQESITTLQSERFSLAKNANMGAIAEYRKKEADYLSR